MDPLELLRHGVPYGVAFALAPDERLAWVVALGELDGRRWDWSRMEWAA